MRRDTLKAVVDRAATVGIVIAAGAILVGMLRSLSAPAAPERRAGTPFDIEPTILPSSIVRNSLGNGPVAIVELSDFACHFCRRHDDRAFPLLKQRFIETGVVRYVAVHFPLERTHPTAVKAAVAAECAAEQGRFWEMRTRLFAHPENFEEGVLAGHAETLGLNLPNFSDCIGGRTSDLVRTDMAEGKKLGIWGTPSFLFGKVATGGVITVRRRVDGAVPLRTFEAEIANLRP